MQVSFPPRPARAQELLLFCPMPILLDSPAVSPAPVSKPRILIIDDDYGPRESLRILLKYDYDVKVASSVAEGIALVQANGFDTIILDNRMPGRTGLEGIIDIRGLDEYVSIIMLTGYGTLETACEAFRNQATDFMTKPPDTDAMLEAVAKNVSVCRAKRARASLAKELSELNSSLSAELGEARPFAKLGQRSDEIIHDLGNPLTILTCCVELLQSKVDEMNLEEGEQWMEALGYIQMIKKSVQHCCSLADAWRQLRDDISENRETVNARGFLDEAVESVQPMTATSGVAFETDFGDVHPDAVVDLDVTQMRRVLHNLLNNAIQACQQTGGKVTMRAASNGNSLEIVVLDNGTGIPASRLAMIFEPYYTTKKEGTGLGLAISKRIVEEHQGTLMADSVPDAGSTFTIRVPSKVPTAVAAN